MFKRPGTWILSRRVSSHCTGNIVETVSFVLAVELDLSTIHAVMVRVIPTMVVQVLPLDL